MFKIIIKMLVFLGLSVGLYASEEDGVYQKHLISLSPDISEIGVEENRTIDIEYDLPILEKSVKRKSIKVKFYKRKVSGRVSVIGNILRFTPDNELEGGRYKVKVKEIKLYDPLTSNKNKKGSKESHDKGSKEKIETKKLKYTFSVRSLTHISLNVADIELAEGNGTNIIVTAYYDNNTTRDISHLVQWSIVNPDIVKITSSTLMGLKEGITTIEAHYKGMLTHAINVTIYKEINGYRLPLEANPAINNATLLGIDSNGNGIRDDVERYIITRYAKDPKYPKTKTAIALQYTWASQKILENPTIESKKYIDNALDCQYYWANKETDKYTQGLSGFEKGKYRRKLKLLTDPILKDKIYNTRERVEQKFRFNASLSGNIFDGRDESIENCRTNIDEIGE